MSEGIKISPDLTIANFDESPKDTHSGPERIACKSARGASGTRWC